MRIATALLAGLIALGIVGGCTAQPSADPPGSSVTPIATDAPATSGPTTTALPDLLTSLEPLVIDGTPDEDQRDAAEGYLRSQQALLKAWMDPVNPDDVALDQWMTGDALNRSRDTLRASVQKGRANRAPTLFRVHVEQFVSDDIDTIRVRTCFTLRQPYFDVATGALIDDQVFSERAENQMRRRGTRWVLAAELQLGETFSGSDACPPA